MIRDLTWLTDEVLCRLNHVRYRANKPDRTREEWEQKIREFSEPEVSDLRRYVGA